MSDFSEESVLSLIADLAAANARALAAEQALAAIDEAWTAATSGRPDYERITGWTGSTDNPGPIFAWVARNAIRARSEG